MERVERLKTRQQGEHRSRAVFVEAGKDPRNGKLAFLGLPAPVRVILTAIAWLKGRRKQERQFAAAGTEEAFAWLRR